MKSESERDIISIIYVYYDTPEEIVDSLRSIPKAAGSVKYEIIVVDNNSPIPLPKRASSFSKVKVIANTENIGFGAAINQAVRLAKGKFLLLVNPDATFFPGAITRLYFRLIKDKTIGVIGPKIISVDGKILDSISLPPLLPNALVIFSYLKKIWPFKLVEERHHLRSLDRGKEHVVPVVSGACMYLRKDVFEKVNGFDKKFFMYFEEADLCIRIQNSGFKNLYYPFAMLKHLVGRSTDNKAWIKKTFESSRFAFFQKHHGRFPAILGELFLRYFTLNILLLLLLLLLSSFLMLYRLGELMMFFGDFGRDYLTARDAILHSEIPLIGITSSVTWLHQGPLSVWFVALIFILTAFNPIAPAYLYAFFGVLTTLLIYKAGEKMFNKTSGFLAALFFTTSPLILANLRIPYHTAPIPLFSIIFMFFLLKFLKDGKYIFILGFSLGILLLLELSNAVLLFVLAVFYVILRPRIKRKNIFLGLFGLATGSAPFILYDITHRFTQTVGFAFWVANRIRLFFGLTFSGASTTASIPSALVTIWGQIRRMIYPQDEVIVSVVLLIVLFMFISKKLEFRQPMKKGLFVCIVWVVVSLLGFAVHAAPGTAYFPLIFVPIALLIGYSFYTLGKRWKPLYLFFAILIVSNGFYTLHNQYFLDTQSFLGSKAKGWEYGIGEAFSERQKMADFIVKDAKGKPLQIKGGGFLRKFSSSVDNYKYLVWYGGGNESNSPAATYTIYQRKEDIPKARRVIYTNSFTYVTKD